MTYKARTERVAYSMHARAARPVGNHARERMDSRSIARAK